MRELGVEPVPLATGIDETRRDGEPVADYVRRMALETTGEKDLRGISKFQGLATRHLRHIIEDPQYKAMLFAWDFDKTKWDKGKTMIVDGEYYVSPTTAESLRKFFSKAA